MDMGCRRPTPLNASSVVLSYVLPAGQYERRQDPATGRQVSLEKTERYLRTGASVTEGPSYRPAGARRRSSSNQFTTTLICEPISARSRTCRQESAWNFCIVGQLHVLGIHHEDAIGAGEHADPATSSILVARIDTGRAGQHREVRCDLLCNDFDFAVLRLRALHMGRSRTPSPSRATRHRRRSHSLALTSLHSWRLLRRRARPREPLQECRA